MIRHLDESQRIKRDDRARIKRFNWSVVTRVRRETFRLIDNNAPNVLSAQ